MKQRVQNTPNIACQARSETSVLFLCNKFEGKLEMYAGASLETIERQ